MVERLIFQFFLKKLHLGIDWNGCEIPPYLHLLCVRCLRLDVTEK